MIYRSAETIPAKLFFKILESEDYSLLSNKKTDKDLKAIFENIKKEDNEMISNREVFKVLNLSKRIESLSSRHESIKLIIYHLRSKFDQELLDILKDYGYKLTGDLQADLDIVERESDALDIKIKSLESKMPTQEGEQLSFDENVLMYSAFTGLGYIDPNVLPLSQYRALINNGNKKIKSLENGNKRKDNQTRSNRG